MIHTSRAVLALLTFVLLGLALLPLVAGQTPPLNPSEEEIRLRALGGWNASLVHQGPAGIWTVEPFKVFSLTGPPELVGLDDQGRCTVHVSYSGRWTPFPAVEDKEWLGAVAQANLDPRRAGSQLYVGGKRGNLYQVCPSTVASADTVLVARFPGEEIHTLVAGELLPSRPGPELLCFLGSGEVFDVRPKADTAIGFTAERVATLPGRLRQGLILPAAPGEAPWIAGALRSGEVVLLRMEESGLAHRSILQEPQGFGRLARRPAAGGETLVLYAARDDGVILRLERGPQDAWQREMVYAGPQGARGVAAGRFHEDPGRESIAVFGYSRKVQLVTRGEDGKWSAETIFEDANKGHWLAAVELDGRNGTDELVGSGYAGRIFLLSRPPGFGLPHVPVEPKTDAGGSSGTERR